MKYRIPIETIRRLFTTWWGLWIIFFIFTSSMAIIIQFILPQVFPKVFLAHGLFVPDSTGFHQIAAQKALEIAEKGWEAWELRPLGQYPTGVASIFYYLWKPEPYSMIPFNAALHATAGCIVFFLLTSFMKNRFVAACGATLFIINPASLEWTAQIHRDGTYILGNLLILIAWLLLIKGVMQKKWQNFLYAFILTLSGFFLIWAPRPYWNQVALVSCILIFALILFYWVLNFRKSFLSLFWLTTAVVTGCFMLLVQLPFLDSTFMPPDIKPQGKAVKSPASLTLNEIEKEIVLMEKAATKAKAVDTPFAPDIKKIQSQENIEVQKKVAKSPKSFAQIEVEKEMILMKKDMAVDTETAETKAIAARLEKIHKELTRRQILQDALYNNLFQYTSESKLMTMKNEVKKREVPEENYGRLSLADLGKRLQALLQWEKELKKSQIVLEQTSKSIFEWARTPYLPDFIENKLYGVWCYRKGTAGSGGNTLIDRYVSLNSAGAFIRYFPRALQIGFLSPFPSEWFRTGSTPATTIGKKIMGSIMILFYICLAFFIWSLWEYRKSLEFWIITLHSTFGIIVFTYVYANVGTLSRLRYGFYMVIIGIGFAFAIQKIIELRQKIQPPSSKAEPGLKQQNEPA